jgi:hypothetical protein
MGGFVGTVCRATARMNRRQAMRTLSIFGATTAAAALLAISPLQAGEHEITTQEVEAYFQQVQEEATEIVRADELHRMVEWIDEHFAEGAVLQANMNIVHGDEHKGFLSMTLDRNDLAAVGGMFAGPFGQMGFEDFSLEVEVFDVIAHGPGAATVTTRWTERATLELPPMGEGADTGTGSVTIEEVVDCTQIVQRTGERLQMGLMTCTGELRF